MVPPDPIFEHGKSPQGQTEQGLEEAAAVATGPAVDCISSTDKISDGRGRPVKWAWGSGKGDRPTKRRGDSYSEE
jgi:hypothetical protein